MEQPENRQDLERLVKLLDERGGNANRSSTISLLGGTIGSAFTAGILYFASAADLVTAKMMLGAIGGASGGVSLMALLAGTLDYHRAKRLADRIAELKQSPNYKAQEGSGPKS